MVSSKMNMNELIEQGNRASEEGRLGEALALYNRALSMEPFSTHAHYNRGLVLERLGRNSEAEEEYRRTITLNPEFVEARNNLGNQLVARGLLTEAIEQYHAAVASNPVCPAALNNLGNAYKAKGQLSKALDFYRRAISADPSAAYASSNLIMSLEYSPAHNREVLYRAARSFQQRHCSAIRMRDNHENSPDPERRLRIGYVSPDFKRHPVGFHLLPVLFYRDRNFFEVFCYSDTILTDEMTEELRSCSEQWRVITGMSDEVVEKIILNDRIDILIDLTGHTSSNRLLLFARKPAPVQVSWLGYFNTTGIDAMDYLITDGVTVPAGEEKWFSETVVRLPDSRFCYAPPSYAPDVASLPALRNGHVTFGSFNNIAKVTDEVVALWSLVLDKVPGSRLLLKSRSFDSEDVRLSYRDRFARHGIEGERLDLRGSSDHFMMLGEYGDIDIALDPFPFSGGLTSCEAMWMGVPVITLPGDRPISRQTRGFLRVLGMQELVAKSSEQYVAIAGEVTTDTKRLSNLRKGLRARMASSPLCDGNRFARNIEQAYRDMWVKWCADGVVGTRRNKGTLQTFPDLAVESTAEAEMIELEPVCDTAANMVAAGDLEGGESLFSSVLERFPEHPRALHALGVISFRRGNPEMAVELITKAVSVKPDFSSAWNNLGNILRETERYEGATLCYRRALEIEPSNSFARANLGSVLAQLGDGEAAISLLQEALAADPGNAENIATLGTMLLRFGRCDEARMQFERALTLRRDRPEYHYNLAISFAETGRLSEAEEYYRSALTLRPDYPQAWGNLALVLSTQGKHDDALSCYQAALRCEGCTLDTHSGYLMFLNSMPGVTQAEIFAESREWERKHALALKRELDFSARSYNPERRLKIGFVSPDFRRHPVSYYFEPFAQAIDRSRFEMFCYADILHRDEVTDRIQDLADRWIDITGLRDDRVAELVMQDEIDILFDLAGHTAHSRLLLFARKPAPVQATWLGYFNTTGLSAIDYLISDGTTILPGEEQWFSETVIRLPGSRFCYAPPSFAPEVVPPPARENGWITFGCFNALRKVSEQVIALWSRVLQAVPGSRLVLKSAAFSSEDIVSFYRKLFTRYGIDAGRLELREASDHQTMLAQYGDIDMVLDPFPYSGGLTSCEALWMGVPIITMPGRLPISRQTQGFLKLLDMEELVARDPDHYVTIAVGLASDSKRLAALRKELRPRMLLSPLCDGERFARNMESACRKMWREWCSHRERGISETISLNSASLNGNELCKKMESKSASELNEVGIALFQQGREEDAVRVFRAAVSTDPSFFPAYRNLGKSLLELGRLGEAVTNLSAAVSIAGDNAGCYVDLGNALKKLGRLDEAIRSYRKALQCDPEYAEAAANLGNSLLCIGETQKALRTLRKASRLAPSGSAVHAALLMGLLYSGTSGERQIYAESRRWGDALVQSIPPAIIWKQRTDIDDTRIRVGYVSPDFRQHSVAFFLEKVISCHNREKFEIFCYANVSREDEVTGRFRGLSDHWRSIHGMSDDDAARLVQQDQIDILVDLTGHTEGNRLGVFARRPAPVQVSWIGYPGTTGLPTINYRITDDVADPEGKADRYHCERLIRLADGFLCYAPPDVAPPIKPLPSLSGRGITFGSFNNPAKLTGETLTCWKCVLDRIPDSTLILKMNFPTDETTREKLVKSIESRGIDPTRVEVLPRVNGLAEHLAAYGRIDIALDPFPYNGTTTTCEALWMGVPVITLRGDRHSARVGASILTAVGLESLIAVSTEDYIDIASSLAADQSRLNELRNGLRSRVASSPLTDGRGFVEKLENAYCGMLAAVIAQ